VADFTAPAKINLHLQVLGKRPDGFHELFTSFAYVDIADELRVEPCDELRVRCNIPHLNGEENLVWQVLNALRERFAIDKGLSVDIDKRLPEQAGLGGGSSDAATALMTANRMWGLGMSRDELIEFATPFGADIPCFLFGRASMACGVGERLRSLETPLPDASVLLVYPGVGLSTARVFSRIDTGELTLSDTADTMRARVDPDMLGHNDLETAAGQLCPEMAGMLDKLREMADKAWMSGSGTACVGLFKDRHKLRDADRLIRKDWPQAWVHAGKLQNEHPFDREWRLHGA